MPFLVGHWYVLVLLLILVLIFWGPGKLPLIGGGVAKAIHDFRNSFRDQGDKTTTKDSEANPAKPSSQP